MSDVVFREELHKTIVVKRLNKKRAHAASWLPDQIIATQTLAVGERTITIVRFSNAYTFAPKLLPKVFGNPITHALYLSVNRHALGNPPQVMFMRDWLNHYYPEAWQSYVGTDYVFPALVQRWDVFLSTTIKLHQEEREYDADPLRRFV